jgi:fructose-1,6-bisphosphatase/inositol monophosphatase family enzyme
MSPEKLVEVGIAGLFSAYDIHEKLGKEGEAKVHKNQFGETALLADIKAEEAVISVLKAAHCPIQLISEEHGTLDIGTSPKQLGVLDGLDGSSVYASQRGKGKYGTMLSIFSSLEPHYEDYLFCGVMLHSPGQELFYASKGDGSFSIANGELRTIHCSNVTNLQKTTKIYVDVWWYQKSRQFVGKNKTKLNCSKNLPVLLFQIHLCWCLIVKRLMQALMIVKCEIIM